MKTLREAAQMALDALEHGLPIIEDFGDKEQLQLQLQHKAISALYEALRAALAQPEQEPVACDCDSPAWCKQYKKCNRVMLGIEPYVAPPQREWQGLTDEEIRDITGVTSADSDWNVLIVHKWVRAIEEKLREKNCE